MKPAPLAVLAAALAWLVASGGVGEAKPAKAKKGGTAPPPAASASRDPTQLRDARTPPPVRLRSALAAPDAPAMPVAPLAPALPSLPGPNRSSLGLTADQGASQCRQGCADTRLRCIATANEGCDHAWSTCVIECNLPTRPR